MFAKFWSLHRDQHDNKPLTVIYANTSNEFASMPKHVKFFCEYIEQKYNIKIDLHIVRSKTTFFDVVKTEGYPVASKKIARMIHDVRDYFAEHDIKYSDIEPHLDQGVSTANYLRELQFPATIILRLSGYTRENRICKTWSIPKKWRFLIEAPFPISEHCCDILKKQVKMSDKKIVLCDADDTIENLCETWVNYLNCRYGTKVAADDVVDWDVSKFFPELTKDQVYAPIYDKEFWKLILPIKGCYKILSEVNKKHDLYIVTAMSI